MTELDKSYNNWDKCCNDRERCWFPQDQEGKNAVKCRLQSLHCMTQWDCNSSKGDICSNVPQSMHHSSPRYLLELFSINWLQQANTEIWINTPIKQYNYQLYWIEPECSFLRLFIYFQAEPNSMYASARKIILRETNHCQNMGYKKVITERNIVL